MTWTLFALFCSYKKRYWKKPLFDAIDRLKETLDRIYGEGKVTLVDATLRWMYHHSKMDGSHEGMLILFHHILWLPSFKL